MTACLAQLPVMAIGQTEIPNVVPGNRVLAPVGVTLNIGGFNLPDGFAESVDAQDRENLIYATGSIADIAEPDIIAVFVRDWMGASRMTHAMGMADVSAETATLVGSGQIVGATFMRLNNGHAIPFIMLIEVPDVSVECYANLVVRTVYTGDFPEDETLLRCVAAQVNQ